jgi:hypothetical protein
MLLVGGSNFFSTKVVISFFLWVSAYAFIECGFEKSTTDLLEGTLDLLSVVISAL